MKGILMLALGMAAGIFVSSACKDSPMLKKMMKKINIQ